MTTPDYVARLTSTFDEQDAKLVGTDPISFEGYAQQINRARAETGLSEACVWGWAEIDGIACALVVMDFAFLGGSMGVVVGEKVARAFDAARRRRAPIVTVTASGGARMQEGMVALAQMAKTAEARRRHHGAGLPHIALLASPTTGGVYASFASLADVMFVERDATVGFAGPRVVRELTGEEPAPDVHTAAFALEHGLVDAIVDPADAASVIGRALRNLTSAASKRAKDRRPPLAEDTSARSAWERLALARDPARPKAPQILDALLTDDLELHGDRQGEDDPAIVVRLGALADTGRRVLAIGQHASGDRRITAAGYRKAIRVLRMAQRFDLPVVTIIDTPGADPASASESEGVARAIAWTFVSMLDCPSPTVAAVTGEGGSGGALAMAVADSVLAWENAVLSVIAPSAAAAILYRDPSRAPELAERLKITATDLLELGIVDGIVPEPAGGAQADPAGAMAVLTGFIADEVDRLAGMRPRSRLAQRRKRWRTTGNRFLAQARN